MSKKTKNSNLIAECVADAKAVASLTKAMRDSSVDNASLFLDTVFKDNAVLKESFTGGMSAALAEKLKQEAADDEPDNDAPAVDDAEVSVDATVTDVPADDTTVDAGAEADVATEAEDKIFVQAVDQEGNEVSVNGTDPEEVKADAAAQGIELQDPVKTEPETDDTTADTTGAEETPAEEIPADDTTTATDDAPDAETEPEEEDEVTLDVNELNEILKELAEDTEDAPAGEENVEVADIEATDAQTDAPVEDNSADDLTGDDVLKKLQDLLKQPAEEPAAVDEEEEIDLETILNEIDTDLAESKKPEDKKDECKGGCKTECKTECKDVKKEECSKEDIAEALRISHEENVQLRKSLEEHKKALDIVKTSLNEASKQLNETTLLNHKLLYTNKLFKDKSLTETQRVSIIEAFDRAKTKREVMITYAIMAENLINSKPIAKKTLNNTVSTITEGLSSKSIGSTKPSNQILTESINHDDLFTKDRWQEMAGIKSSY